MVKKLERFFGLEVKVAKDIEVENYAATRKIVENALRDRNLCEGNDFNIYITRIELRVTRQRVFKVAPLTERLEKIKIRLTVNQRDRQLKRIFFLNKELATNIWLMSADVETSADKHMIQIICDGHYCSRCRNVELLVMTCVKKDVPSSARKLKMAVTAYATPGFAPLLVNSNGRVTTNIDYYLDSQVQFLLPFNRNGE